MVKNRTLIVANWKMHLNASQASILVHRLQERIETRRNVEVVLCPTFLTLQPLSRQIDRRKFKLGAQDAHYEDEGAFTGAVSASLLRDLTHYVIVGHSERRYKFGDTDDIISKKVAAVFRSDMVPILCVGETKEDKLNGHTKQVLHDQIMVGLRNATPQEVAKMVIAYEPVWAISNGKDFKGHSMPKPDELVEAVNVIRHNIHELYGKKAAKNLRVLYGGSVSADTAGGLLDIDGVDGLLVGGASLNYDQFSKIVGRAHAEEQDA